MNKGCSREGRNFLHYIPLSVLASAYPAKSVTTAALDLVAANFLDDAIVAALTTSDALKEADQFLFHKIRKYYVLLINPVH